MCVSIWLRFVSLFVQPFVRWVKLEGESARKFAESLWKLLLFDVVYVLYLLVCSEVFVFW